MNRQLKILLLIIFLVNTYIVNAQSLLKSNNCIIGYTSSISNILTIKTVSQSCETTCSNYCVQKFKLLNYVASDGDISNLSLSQDLINLKNGVLINNQDRLQSCLSSCYTGQKFDTKIRIPITIDINTGTPVDDTGDLPYPWKCDIMSDATTLQELSCNSSTDIATEDTGSICSQNELDAAYYSSGDIFNIGDKISISMSNITSSNSSVSLVNQIVKTNPNTIYLCGFKSVFFSPEYFVGDKASNVTYPTSTTFSLKNNNGQLNTGLKVKNGDYLNIQYIGRYNSDCDDKYVCKQKDEDYKLNITIGGTKVDFDVSPYQFNDYDYITRKNKSQECNTCGSNGDEICPTINCGSYTPNQTSLYGLNPNTFWQGSPYLFNKLQNTQPYYDQFRNTILNGNIENISDTAQDLIIQYPNVKSNSQGGYFVSIEWRGCQYTNGERLQYTVVNSALKNGVNFNRYMISSNGPIWQDLIMVKNADNTISSIIDINSSQLNIPNSQEFSFQTDSNIISVLPKDITKYTGLIYFRIKTLEASEAGDLDDNQRSRANTSGNYNVKVVNLTQTTGILQDLVGSFMGILTGIPENIFNGFMNSLQYLIIIRLLLICYIAFTGLSFMIGLAPLNQQEAIIRIFKIAVVIMLFSENSFEFFNQYLFNAFSFKAMNFLANTFTPEIDMNFAPGLNSNSTNCFAPGIPIRMLCVLEKDLNLVFSWSFWNRMLGLAFSGFFLGAIAIIIGIILYIIVILKITALYCMGLLITTITLSLAPIFLPLILFKYTKGFFDSWIKQLISLLLQPVFIFISISLFRVLFIALIQSLMGNGACEMCFFQLFTWCWFKIYLPLSLSSSPSFTSMPMSNIGMLLSLYFVGHGMYSFSTYAAGMSQRLINFTILNIAEAKVGPKEMYDNAKSFGSMTYNTITSPLDVLGVDDQSRQARRQNRQARSRTQDQNNNPKK
jgi:type IV secretion system protein VirB6